MVITELHIENIKGLQNFELKQSIQPNRPNILVAPNGFGKTSLAIAFKSLKNSKFLMKVVIIMEIILINLF